MYIAKTILPLQQTKNRFFNKSCGNPYTPSVCFADTFPILPYGKTGQAFGRKKAPLFHESEMGELSPKVTEGVFFHTFY